MKLWSRVPNQQTNTLRAQGLPTEAESDHAVHVHERVRVHVLVRVRVRFTYSCSQMR